MRTDERFYTSAYTFLRMWRQRPRPYGRIMQHGSRRLTSGQAAAAAVGGPVAGGPTVTAAVFGAVAEHATSGPDLAGRPALIDTADGQVLTYGEFAAVVPTAAAGLARRGVLTGDVAAVYVPCARQLAIAVHTLTAAGAVPAPIPRTGITSADELAELLTSYEARMLITAQPLGGLALDAVDRSYVRQVFAFGEVPGATPFGELMGGGGPTPRIDPRRDYALIQPRFRPEGPVGGPWGPGGAGGVGDGVDGTAADAADDHSVGGAAHAFAGRSAGAADGAAGDRRERLTHTDRLADLDRLVTALAVEQGDVLVGVSVGCSAATWISLIDAALLRGATFVAVTRPGPAALLRAIEAYDATLAVVAPVTLRALAHEEAAPPRLRGRPPRLLVAGPTPEEVVRACRRHDWSVDTLA